MNCQNYVIVKNRMEPGPYFCLKKQCTLKFRDGDEQGCVYVLRSKFHNFTASQNKLHVRLVTTRCGKMSQSRTTNEA